MKCKASSKPCSSCSCSTPSPVSGRTGTAETWLACFHPHSERWTSVGGHVEVCGICSECRRGTAERYWPPSKRLQRRVGDEMLTFSTDGRNLYRRDPVA